MVDCFHKATSKLNSKYAPIRQYDDSADLIHFLFQQVAHAIATLNEDLYIDVANQTFVDLFTKISLIKIQPGMSLRDLPSNVSNFKSKMVAACEKALCGENITLRIETEHQQKIYYYEFLFSLLNYPSCPKKKIMVQINDWTEQVLQEKQIHQQSELALSCRSRVIDEMISALAHEINQPLTAIIAYTQSCLYLLNKEPTAHTNLFHPIQQTLSQAEHAGKILHNMKEMVHQDSLYGEETDINQLIKETLNFLSYELLDEKLKITLNLEDNLPKLIVNNIHIMQVILNLSRNAIEAMRSIGENQPRLLIETNKTPEGIIVYVRDNGPGISPELQDKILVTYFTTKPQGMGIGLGLCRTLVEEHGGQLSFQSNTTKGASFFFTLPLHNSKHIKKSTTFTYASPLTKLIA